MILYSKNQYCNRNKYHRKINCLSTNRRFVSNKKEKYYFRRIFFLKYLEAITAFPRLYILFSTIL
jgi:hypothetical protein